MSLVGCGSILLRIPDNRSIGEEQARTCSLKDWIG